MTVTDYLRLVTCRLGMTEAGDRSKPGWQVRRINQGSNCHFLQPVAGLLPLLATPAAGSFAGPAAWSNSVSPGIAAAWRRRIGSLTLSSRMHDGAQCACTSAPL